MKRLFRLLLLMIALVQLSSCLVSKKKFDEQEALAKKYLAEKNKCNEDLNAANSNIETLSNKVKELQAEIDKLTNDKNALGTKQNKLKKDYDDLAAQCEKWKADYSGLVSSSANEKDALSKLLAEKERELSQKQAALAEQQKANDLLAKSLSEREARVKELEDLIARKDSAVMALKKKITDALTGFSSSDLQVSVKDGKVYVSLSDKLLFNVGSFVVDAKGKGALLKIAEVLNKQTDIGIMVEGHTDNKQYLSPDGNIKNNWDLSVMRASSVAYLLVNDGKVNAARVEAAGRGEHQPVEANDTPEGRSKNRRIEVILSPDLKGIWDILNGQ